MTNVRPATKDHYAALGVLPTAEAVVIRAAYRELAKKYHPDKWTGDRSAGEARMRELNEAYELLSNEQRRREYDRERNKATAYNFTDFAESPAAQEQTSQAQPAARQEEIKKDVIAIRLIVIGLQIALRLFVYGSLALLAIGMVLGIGIAAFQFATGHY